MHCFSFPHCLFCAASLNVSLLYSFWSRDCICDSNVSKGEWLICTQFIINTLLHSLKMLKPLNKNISLHYFLTTKLLIIYNIWFKRYSQNEFGKMVPPLCAAYILHTPFLCHCPQAHMEVGRQLIHWLCHILSEIPSSDFWRQHRCIFYLWRILCIPFHESWARKNRKPSESYSWWSVFL